MVGENRNINPFRKAAEAAELNMVEENRIAILGIIKHIDELEQNIEMIKNRLEVLENDRES